MDLEKRSASLLGGMIALAVRAGFDADQSRVLAEDILNRCLLKLETDSSFAKVTSQNPNYFTNYVFRSLHNAIINEKRRTKKLDHFSYNEKGELLDEPSDTSDNPEEALMEKEKKVVIKEFIEKLSEVCTEEERRYLEVFLSLAEESQKVNISKAGRLLGISASEAHNLMKKIRIRAADLEAEQGMLENIGTMQTPLEYILRDFLCNLFIENPEDEISSELTEMARRYISRLSLSQIDLLSKALQ